MSESETLIEQWEQLAEDKTELLEELILVQADDIGKLDVKEVMLRYFENRQRLSCDSWDNDNQALRQLFSASCRVPRVRHFPGSAGKVVGKPKMPPGGNGGGGGGAARRSRAAGPLTVMTNQDDEHGRQKQQQQQQQQQQQHQHQQHQHQQQQPQERQKPDHQQDQQHRHQAAEQLAHHLITSEDTYEGIERELATLSEQLVSQSLNQAVYNSAVHQLAVRLVRRALDRASEHLGGRSSSAESTGDRDARIDAIAQELARSHARGDPSELTFTSERAESVAGCLLDQVIEDAAHVVSSEDHE